jgi:predicted transposase YbfD/YdcC
MSQPADNSIVEHFSGIDDPRIERCKEHDLMNILTIAICAVIGGADSWVDIEMFGNAKLAWFESFLSLPNGIPSHDTFGRVFGRLDTEQFQQCFLNWVQAVNRVTEGQVVAVDGQQMRGTQEKLLGKQAINMVSAWACENHLVLGQRPVEEAGSEITTLPELLRVLELSGCLVTVDALGCQVEVAQAILDRQADYVLAVKGNQGTLYEDIEELFAGAEEVAYREVAYDYARTVNKGHGRIEIRQCWAIDDPSFLDYIRRREDWPALHSIVKVVCERRTPSETTVKTRYYITSLPPQAARLLDAVRSHWQIENGLHWVLDIAFNQDHSRIRKDNAPANFAILHHIALNLLKRERSLKVGVKAKRLRAGWDECYLLKVLAGPS